MSGTGLEEWWGGGVRHSVKKLWLTGRHRRYGCRCFCRCSCRCCCCRCCRCSAFVGRRRRTGRTSRTAIRRKRRDVGQENYRAARSRYLFETLMAYVTGYAKHVTGPAVRNETVRLKSVLGHTRVGDVGAATRAGGGTEPDAGREVLSTATTTTTTFLRPFVRFTDTCARHTFVTSAYLYRYGYDDFTYSTCKNTTAAVRRPQQKKKRNGARRRI